MKAAFKGGLHIAPRSKNPTKSEPIKSYVSDTVTIPMSMHIGAPSNLLVKKGDRVLCGQVIGEPVGPLGLPIHSSISGTVIDIKEQIYLNENPVTMVTIENDFTDEWVELKPLGPVEYVDKELIIPAIKNAGICGMGGAGFPTHAKLDTKDKKADIIIANGAECETYLTADHRLMLEEPKLIVSGLKAVMKALDVNNGVIAIEDNKQDAIKAIKECVGTSSGIRVVPLKTRYPQGGEKQLIKAVTGREVPTGGLPIMAGAIVLNVGTCAAIAEAIELGKPLTERITTVTGCVRKPSNIKVRIGTLIADVIGECGGYTEEPGKLIAGGGMTGNTLYTDDLPVTKTTSGILLLNKKDSEPKPTSPCIRCGRCINYCPMRLMPRKLELLYLNRDYEGLKEAHLKDCILCGTCSYICPAGRHLTDTFKIAKVKLTAYEKKGGAAK